MVLRQRLIQFLSFFLIAGVATFGGAEEAAPAQGKAAQGKAGQGKAGQGKAAGNYLSALELLPESVAGMVRIPNLPALCVAWKTTQLSGLSSDPLIRPLIELNLGPDGTVWKKIGDRIGLRPKDLADVGSGEVVGAWLSTPQNRRHPSSLSLIADIRGNEAKASKLLERIDTDLKKAGSTRTDVTHLGQTLRVYRPPTKPGQLLIEQIVICMTNERIIAADLDSVVTEIVDAIAAGGRTGSLAEGAELKLVMSKSYDRMKTLPPGLPADESLVEWFALPLEFGRVIRDVAKVDRGNKVKIIDLLERQGFDVLRSAGGVLAVGGETFDMMHRGYVHAPASPEQKERFRLAARMLDFPNSPLAEIPAWVPESVASFTRMNWKLETAFWASETLVNEALDSNIFRPSIEGIRDDEEGPQIDLATEVLPHLDDQLIILTDSTTPVTIDSDRLLVAVKVSDARAIAQAVRKAMEVEPDVVEVQTVPGVRIWKVQRGEGQQSDEEVFADLGFAEEETAESKPLLNTWAIALVPAGQNAGAAYLVFASHVELLEEVARRMTGGNAPNFAKSDEAIHLIQTLRDVGANDLSIERLVRFRVSLRTKYELARKGELRDSDSIAATLIRRLLENQPVKKEIQRPDGGQWPEFSKIEKYFGNAAAFMETTDEGWTLNAFVLRNR